MKKNVFPILLSLTMCASMVAPAFATEAPEATNTAETTAAETTDAATTEAAETTDAATTEAAETTDAAEGAEATETEDSAAKALDAATRLNELGLFAGVGDNEDGTPNFDLDRTATRAEGITMLVKLLGQDAAAQAGTWTTPFTDVPDWAAPYVGYAFENGLTSGTSETTFGTADTLSATQYLTFVLRALGYEVGADFEWDSAWTLTDELALTAGQYNAESEFLRADAVVVSATALDMNVKGSEEQTLLNVIEANLAAAETETPAEGAEGTEAETTETEGTEAEGTETEGTETTDETAGKSDEGATKTEATTEAQA